MKKFIGIFFLSIFAVLFFGILGIYFLLESGCANEIQTVINSPSGKNRVIIFERNCGATTGFSTQVSILPSWKQWLVKTGNIFIADTDHGKAPAASWGGPEVETVWKSDTVLIIKHHPKARTFKAEQNFKNIRIEYLTTEVDR